MTQYVEGVGEAGEGLVTPLALQPAGPTLGPISKGIGQQKRGSTLESQSPTPGPPEHDCVVAGGLCPPQCCDRESDEGDAPMKVTVQQGFQDTQPCPQTCKINPVGAGPSRQKLSSVPRWMRAHSSWWARDEPHYMQVPPFARFPVSGWLV